MLACIRLLVLPLAVLVCLPAAAPAQNDNDYELVRSFYRHYLNREPTRREVANWVTVLRNGQSPAYVQGLFLASDEYFRLQGSDSEAWVAAAFTELVGRQPQPFEVRSLLRQVGGVSRQQRIQLVQLIQEGQEQPQAGPPNNVPGQAVELAASLCAEARRFVDAAQAESVGTWQGRRLTAAGNNLIAACDRFRRALAGNATGEQRRRAFRELRLAFQAVADAVNNPSGTAPNATGVINVMATQINMLIALGFERESPFAAPYGREYGRP